MRRFLPALSALALLAAVAAPAHAQDDYTAERFDVVARLEPGGALRVTETVVFRFADGPFTFVFRDIPTRRTDGIDVIEASMDGQRLPFGGDTGQVDVEPRGRAVRVRWRFAGVSGAAHTFTLTYLAHGVAQQAEGADLVEWQALPTRHDYEIVSSTVRLESPDATPLGPPEITQRRTGSARVDRLGDAVVVSAGGVARNGWIAVGQRFPARTVAPVPPAWQQARLEADARRPYWLAGAGAALLIGIAGLVAARGGYRAPHPPAGVVHLIDAPDQSAPALAGALAANGSAMPRHVLATLFDLAARGHLTITQARGSFGSKRYIVEARGTASGLAPYERALMDDLLTRRTSSAKPLDLGKLCAQSGTRWRAFREGVKASLAGAELYDAERARIRARVHTVTATLATAGGVGLGLALVGAASTGEWAPLVPAALLLAALAGVIAAGAMTPLSDEGLVRRARWRAFTTHLKTLARGETASGRSDAFERYLPHAVALGAGAAWARAITRSGGTLAAPPWFHADPAGSHNAAFLAMIASTTSSAGGAGGGSGSAGGGASGAG